MHETQRKAYLNAMGIDVYYPRVLLPGAKKSPDYGIELEEQEQPLSVESSRYEKKTDSSRNQPIEDDNQHQSKEIAFSVSATRSSSENLQQIADKDNEKPPEQPDAIGGNELRFALRYFKITDRVAVLDEYPLQQSAESRVESVQLLKNILLALNVTPGEEELVSESFNWPLLEGFVDDRNEATAARQALLGFIAGRQQQDGFNNLLVFAGQIDELLIGAADSDNKRDYKMDNCESFITITQSLQSMLSYSQLKKDVWQQIQSLRIRIQELQ